jgi:hypothetical protein
MSKEAMNLALEALKTLVECFDYEQFTSVCELDDAKDAITTLEEALAKQSDSVEHDEPAFYAHDGYLMTPERAKFLGFPLDSILALYTTPQQRTAAEGEDTRRVWVGLTDEDIRPLCKESWVFDTVKQWSEIIEAKLKEKNNGSR